jgi:hypothetical protein
MLFFDRFLKFRSPWPGLFLLLPLALLGACERQEPAACSALNLAIDRHIVAAAILQQEGDVQDRSASQQAARLALVHNHLLGIQTQISLMGQHGCRPRPSPADPAVYADDARNCYLSSLSASASKVQERPHEERQAMRDKALAACNFSRWQVR